MYNVLAKFETFVCGSLTHIACTAIVIQSLQKLLFANTPLSALTHMYESHPKSCSYRFCLSLGENLLMIF